MFKVTAWVLCFELKLKTKNAKLEASEWSNQVRDDCDIEFLN